MRTILLFAIVAQAAGVAHRGPLECGLCKSIAAKAREFASNASALAHAIAALDGKCAHAFHNGSSIERLCEDLAKSAVGLIPNIENGLSSLAWDDHATCAALGTCHVPCCAHATAPEQVHLSLSRRPSEMVVMWTTLRETPTHTVEWGLAPGRLTSTSGGNVTTYTWFGWEGSLHRAVMTGLKPTTRYYYRVGDASGGFSPVHSFRTLDPTAGGTTPLRIAWVTDMGWGGRSSETIDKLINLTKSEAIDLLIHPGDIGYADGNMAGWDLFLRKIEPIASSIPYLTTPGNHELWFNFDAYKHRFWMADDGAHQSMCAAHALNPAAQRPCP